MCAPRKTRPPPALKLASARERSKQRAPQGRGRRARRRDRARGLRPRRGARRASVIRTSITRGWMCRPRTHNVAATGRLLDGTKTQGPHCSETHPRVLKPFLLTPFLESVLLERRSPLVLDLREAGPNHCQTSRSVIAYINNPCSRLYSLARGGSLSSRRRGARARSPWVVFANLAREIRLRRYRSLWAASRCRGWCRFASLSSRRRRRWTGRRFRRAAERSAGARCT